MVSPFTGCKHAFPGTHRSTSPSLQKRTSPGAPRRRRGRSPWCRFARAEPERRDVRRPPDPATGRPVHQLGSYTRGPEPERSPLFRSVVSPTSTVPDLYRYRLVCPPAAKGRHATGDRASREVESRGGGGETRRLSRSRAHRVDPPRLRTGEPDAALRP